MPLAVLHFPWQRLLTSRNASAACRANDALCLEITGDPATRISLDIECRTRQSLLATSADWQIANASGRQERSYTLAELAGGSDGFSMGGPPSWVRVHRAVPGTSFRYSGAYHRMDGETGCFYLRVTQENGQMAWSSPIWVK